MINVTICIGSSCHLKGSRDIIQRLDQLVKEKNLTGKVTLNGSFCMDNCAGGVCVNIDDTIYSVSPDTVDAFFEKEVMGRL